jgi:vesicle coat complex subunit
MGVGQTLREQLDDPHADVRRTASFEMAKGEP